MLLRPLDHKRRHNTFSRLQHIEELCAEFLTRNRNALVMENGHVIYDMSASQFSIVRSAFCVTLTLYNDRDNRNLFIRSVKKMRYSLVLTCRRIGSCTPTVIRIYPLASLRNQDKIKERRIQYAWKLGALLKSEWSDLSISALRTTREVGIASPAYARCTASRGMSVWAVIGVGPGEPESIINVALSYGLLWLHQCREKLASRKVVKGIRLILPQGMASATASRLAWLNDSHAHYELWEWDEAARSLKRFEVSRRQNSSATTKARVDGTKERLAVPIAQLTDRLPTEVKDRIGYRPDGSLRLHLEIEGLVVATIASIQKRGTCQWEYQVTFPDTNQVQLITDSTVRAFEEAVLKVYEARACGKSPTSFLFRAETESWFRARLEASLSSLEPGFDMEHYYNIPVEFDRGKQTNYTATVDNKGRMVVVVFQAAETLHLLLRGLDAWIAISTLQSRNNCSGLSLQDKRYFDGVSVSADRPRLVFFISSLKLHPSTQVILKYVSPDIDWQVVAVSEHWRNDCHVVFRKTRHSLVTTCE